ncbi:MAG: hypothetical protein D6729_13990 [Deltaproteobacteria bacterium]|nr:MAG: hypothetical protein D6729_13990 [Deltaproteobacteria bacterium]
MRRREISGVEVRSLVPDPGGESRRARYLRRARRVAVGILLVFVGLAAALLIVLRLYLTEARTRTLVERLASEVLTGQVRLSAFVWERFPEAFELRGLELHAPTGEEVLAVERVRVDLDLRALLIQQVRLRRLEAEGVDLCLSPSPGRSEGFALVDALRPAAAPGSADEAGGSPWSVVLESVALSRVHLRLTTEALRLEIQDGALEGGRLDLALPEVESEVEAVRTGALTLASGTHRITLSEASVAGARYQRTGDPKEAVFEFRAQARTGASELRFEGRLGGLDERVEMEASGRARAELDLADPALHGLLSSTAVSEAKPRGHLSVEAEIEGPLRAPRLRVSGQGEKLSAWGIDLDDLMWRAESDGRTVTLEQATVRIAPGRVQASGRLALEATAAYQLKLSMRDLPLRRIVARFTDLPLPRSVRGRIEVQGTGFEDPQARVAWSLRLRDLPRPVPAPLSALVRAEGKARVGRDAAQIEGFSLRDAGLEVTGSGRAGLRAAAPWDLRLRLRHPEPGALMDRLGLPVVADALAIELTVRGTLEAPRVEGRATAERLRGPWVAPADLSVPLRFEGGRLFVDEATARVGGGRVQATGWVQLLEAGGLKAAPPFDLVVDASAVKIDGFTQGQAHGRLSGRLSVRGTPAALAGGGLIELGRLRVRDLEADRARMRLRLHGQQVEVADLEVRPLPVGRISGRGRYDLGREALQGSLDVEGMTLEEVARLLGRPLPLTGALSLDAQLSGTRSAPRYHVRGQLSDVEAWGGRLGALRVDVRGDREGAGGTVRVDGPAGRATVAGRIDFAPASIDLRVDAPQIALAALPGIAGSELGLSGAGRASLEVSGMLPWPAGVRGRIALRDLAMRGQTLGTGELAATFVPRDETHFGVRADAFGSITARAIAATAPQLEIEGEAKLRGARLARLWPLPREYEVDVAGSGSVRYHLRLGQGDGAGAEEVSAELPELAVVVGKRRLVAREPLRVSWDGERLHLESVHLAGEDGEVRARGTLGRSLALGAGGRLELGLVAPLLPSIARARGVVAFDVQVGGTLESPSFDGGVRLVEPVSLRPRSLFRSIALSRANLRFEGRTLRLSELLGELDGGPFAAEGRLELDGWGPGAFQVDLEGQNLPFRTTDLALELNADVQLGGSPSRMKVSGAVEVVQGRYLPKFELNEFIVRIRRPDVDEPLGERYPILRSVDLDVAVSSVDSMELRAVEGPFGIELGLDADLHVTGTVADPTIEGRVSASRGAIRFPKARLDVTRAVIEFVPSLGRGETPLLDIQAEGEVEPQGSPDAVPFHVTLSLSGPLGETPLELSSEPPLEDQEILALLTLGIANPYEALAGSTGSSADNRWLDAGLVFAGSQLAEPLTRFFTRELERLLNVELGLKLSTEITSSAVAISASKELTPRLRLEGTWRQTYDAQSITSGRVRFLLSDRLFLEGSGESVSGSSASNDPTAPEEGSRSRLELKYRFFGD